MQFTNIASLLSLLAVASANTVTFKGLDTTDRTVYFTANAGLEAVPPIEVPAGATVKADIPHQWIGNFYSVSAGKPNVPGMLGEVNFNSWMELTFFDVSAIVDPADHDGVQVLYPSSDKKPHSGCVGGLWPCNNAYYLPDDVQTKSTGETDLICELGVGANGLAARDLEAVEESPSFTRNLVTRKW